MPYGLKNETPKQTKKIEEIIDALVRDGMEKERAVPIAISTVKKMKKKKKAKKSLADKLFLADLESETVALGEKMFKKQVLRYGKWKYNGSDFVVDEQLVDTLINNFGATWQNVPVTRGHKENDVLEEHPEYVVTYVKALEKDENGLNAYFDVEDEETADEVVKKYRDVSAGILEEYEDHETGVNKGSVLTHVALVVEPYIKKLSPFIQFGDIKKAQLVHLTDFEQVDNINSPKMADEVTNVGTPIVEETPEVANPVDVIVGETAIVDEVQKEETKVESAPVQEEQPKVEPKQKEDSKADGEEITLSEKASKELAEIKAREKALADKVSTMEAEKVYSKALSEGKIVPAQKDVAMALLKAGSNTIHFGESSKSVSVLFAEFLEKSAKIIKFGEDGTLPSDNQPVDPIAKNLTQGDIAGFQKLYGAKWRENAEAYLKSQGVDTKVPETVIVVPTVIETKKEEVVPETKVDEQPSEQS